MYLLIVETHLSIVSGRVVVCSFFFFSSRRRHTRLQGDWSSDVCSSDLLGARADAIAVTGDTRYDSVAERAARLDKTREPLARLAATSPETFTIVAGSTWPDRKSVV